MSKSVPGRSPVLTRKMAQKKAEAMNKDELEINVIKQLTKTENIPVPSELHSRAEEKVNEWLEDCGSQKSSKSSSSRSSSVHSTSYYVKGLPLLSERLKKQIILIESVMVTNNSSMMSKEMENLEKVYEKIQV